jgi:SRSO17 transposase
MGQNLVFLVLVKPKLTVPVGFSFYEPDPAKKAWQVEDKRLKAEGIAKKDRPKEPERSPLYPTKQELALQLLKKFAPNFNKVHVQCVLADALYSDKAFMDAASLVFGSETQVISQWH